MRTTLCALVCILVRSCMLFSATPGDEWDVDRLAAAYRTAPQGYPAGNESRGMPYARPDTSAPFRWHFYHDRAIERFEEARMKSIVLAFNPLEGAGAEVPYRSSVKLAFVPEHATSGTQGLKVFYPAAEIEAGRATALVRVVPGPSDCPAGSRYHVTHAIAAYWPHWRFLKFDAFNPQDEEVRISVAGVPLVLHPGSNVVAVKTADAAGQNGPHSGVHETVDVTVRAPRKDVALHLDNFRVEQEVPQVLQEKGRMLQFAARADPEGEPLLWPGFTAVGRDDLYEPARGWGWTVPAATRIYRAATFRSFEHGLLWGYCAQADCPFRIDVPNGRYGIGIFANPAERFAWDKGAEVQINGVRHAFLPARTAQEVRQLALGGEAWDWRPGACLWEELVRRPYYLSGDVLYADASDGHLSIAVPPDLALRAIMVFPAGEKDEALAELGRLNFLLAESYDTTHGWIKGDAAERLRYIGLHEESSRPQIIPQKLAALGLKRADFDRGFVVFHRPLLDPVYPDSIPSPQEAAAKPLEAFAAPGQYECLTLGILPLTEVHGLSISVSDLESADGAVLPSSHIDVRMGRYHQKCMDYGHHNHNYNHEEHDLVRRPSVDLYAASARRVYLDIHVPPDTAPGRYAGEVTLRRTDRQAAVRGPLVIDVLPIKLQTPLTFFATEEGPPELRRYGINAIAGSYNAAAKAGYRAALVCPYDAVPAAVRGKRLGWQSMAANKEFVETIITEGLAGQAPRVFWGGYLPGRDPDRDHHARFVAGLLEQFPGMEITGYNIPVYLFAGPGYTWGWDGFDRGQRTRDKPGILWQAAAGGPKFWFVDWVKNSKEHAARFTFGFWCWKLRPMGRYTTFIHNLSYFSGTAKAAYPHLPYYALLDIGGSNRYGAFSESVEPGQVNPVRDLVLVREGIDDYRYMHTLDSLLAQAEARNAADDAVKAAGRFRDELAESLSLDLRTYYESRGSAELVSYAENWYVRPDSPWTAARFDTTRRECARHIVELAKRFGMQPDKAPR